ncbi:HAD family hydrolase [Galbitalea soli]|uniref:HAD family hydrolase n=1 Tax=Galbitalea soli TaxID=1268042 RepID=A0A7C9TNK6_9MICO|nr:HAD family hydrolase [Galbitalea soli]NEM89839.1 HAD family hydrolase [Galbitalea soli]NYJ30543.1 phosphoglycolate phosphatase-like HAD superfamily hydrolase [Galbitalea soli]
MSTYILWDVDGTLLRNGREAANLYHEAVELSAGRALEQLLPHMHGKTDGQILAETLAAHGLDAGLHETARHHLDELSRLRHERGLHREICPGIPEALDAFAARGYVNALLTGNSERRARFKIDGSGLPVDAFDWQHSYFGDITPLRSELTIRAQEELLDHRTVIIGDTPGDDIAAQAAGIPFIGVATGVYSVDDLRETGAALLIEDFDSGLDAVLEFLAR